MSLLNDLVNLFHHQQHPQAQAQQHPLSGAIFQGMQTPPIGGQVAHLAAQAQRQPVQPQGDPARFGAPLDLTFSYPGLPNFQQSFTSPQGSIRPQLQSDINGYAQPSYPMTPLQGTGRQVQPSYDNPNDLYTNRLNVL
jgi:hypothetical protein